jgi:hypothetical protein
MAQQFRDELPVISFSNAEQVRNFERLLTTEPYKQLQAMNTTWFEKGIEKGREIGARQLLREQLEIRFGPLPPLASERLGQLPMEQLKALARALIRAPSLRALGLED